MSNTLSDAALDAAVPSRAASPAQIRAARGLLNWSMADLAQAARLSIATIKRMEMGQPQPISAGAYALVTDALRAAGVRLLTDDGQGEGVWLDRTA